MRSGLRVWRRFYDQVTAPLPGPEYVDLEFKMRCFGDVFCNKNSKNFCFHLQKQGLHPDDAEIVRTHRHQVQKKPFQIPTTHRCGSLLKTEN